MFRFPYLKTKNRLPEWAWSKADQSLQQIFTTTTKFISIGAELTQPPVLL